MAVAKYLYRTVSKYCGKYSLWYSLALLAVLFSGVVSAQNAESDESKIAERNAAQALGERLSATDGLRGQFVQTLTDAYGRTMERSSGRLLLSKPRLRWETDSPYPQTITVDEEWVRIYDPDLEQVTQRAVTSDATEVPLTLLTQADITLMDNYSVYAITDEADQSYALLPKSEDALIERIELRFHGFSISMIDILDHLGQRTRIELRALESGIELSESAFVLELPAGTEVVEG